MHESFVPEDRKEKLAVDNSSESAEGAQLRSMSPPPFQLKASNAIQKAAGKEPESDRAPDNVFKLKEFGEEQDQRK